MLDDKLREILKTIGPVADNEITELNAANAIALIKSVFKDEGYFKLGDGNYAKFADLRLEGRPNYEDRVEALMTGQEWYSRFLKELGGKPPIPNKGDASTTGYVGFVFRHSMEAAKRAAGIEE
jgi:hypothetical protein